jgi:hypothetical protein
MGQRNLARGDEGTPGQLVKDSKPQDGATEMLQIEHG